MYKAIELFTDLEDNNHRYEIGDTYPRAGLEPTDERIALLMGSDNKRGMSLIEEVADEKPAEDEAATKKPAAKKPATKNTPAKKPAAAKDDEKPAEDEAAKEE